MCLTPSQTIHKAHKKQGQDGLGGAQQIDYANREMTMIKALVVNRNNKEAMGERIWLMVSMDCS